MALKSGSKGDVYIATGTGTTMTAEACSLVSGTTYQVTNTARRYFDKTATWLVYANAVLQPESAYELVYAGGKIVFKSAPATPVTVTGKFLAISSLGQCDKWTLNAGPTLVDSHLFGDTWEKKTAIMQKASATVGRFYNGDGYELTNIANKFVLVLYEDQAVGSRYQMIAHMSGVGIEADARALMRSSISFEVDGWVDYAAS